MSKLLNAVSDDSTYKLCIDFVVLFQEQSQVVEHKCAVDDVEREEVRQETGKIVALLPGMVGLYVDTSSALKLTPRTSYTAAMKEAWKNNQCALQACPITEKSE